MANKVTPSPITALNMCMLLNGVKECVLYLKDANWRQSRFFSVSCSTSSLWLAANCRYIVMASGSNQVGGTQDLWACG